MGQHLLVCSGGGHLKQLFTLAQRIGIDPDDQYWVTFDTGLSRTLLKGRETTFATYAAPRDARNILRNSFLAHQILRTRRFTSAISTGSSLAVSFLPLAARRGLPSHFIETAARAAGPSMTGRIISRDRRVHTYTQYADLANDRWLYRGSIFDEFAPGEARQTRSNRRAVVTLGTTESYGFDRLIRRLLPLLDGWDVLWQVGRSDVSGYPIEGRMTVPHAELQDAMRNADVVISHAGTGAALTALELGICPVLVPRLSSHNEHVDDHQLEIAESLNRRGLAVMMQVEGLDGAVLLSAGQRTVLRSDHPPAFVLQDSITGARHLSRGVA